MNVFDEVASSPMVGDHVVLPNGLVEYVVTQVARVSAPELPDIMALRMETFREPPYQRSAAVVMSFEVWADLAHRSSTVWKAVRG